MIAKRVKGTSSSISWISFPIFPSLILALVSIVHTSNAWSQFSLFIHMKYISFTHNEFRRTRVIEYYTCLFRIFGSHYLEIFYMGPALTFITTVFAECHYCFVTFKICSFKVRKWWNGTSWMWHRFWNKQQASWQSTGSSMGLPAMHHLPNVLALWVSPLVSSLILFAVIVSIVPNLSIIK